MRGAGGHATAQACNRSLQATWCPETLDSWHRRTIRLGSRALGNVVARASHRGQIQERTDVTGGRTGRKASRRRKAFGAPGIEPRWRQDSRDGVGTAHPGAAVLAADRWGPNRGQLFSDQPQLRDLEDVFRTARLSFQGGFSERRLSLSDIFSRTIETEFKKGLHRDLALAVLPECGRVRLNSTRHSW